MENQNNFTNPHNDKLIISYELLQLMEWIVDHESDGLKKLIAKSLKHGFDEQLMRSKNYKEFHTPEQMQNTIIDFLGLLEILLYETTNEQEVNNIIQKNIMPAIDQIDTNSCDTATLRSSIATVNSKLQRNPKENAQQLFLKELLKRWKPNKNSELN